MVRIYITHAPPPRQNKVKATKEKTKTSLGQTNEKTFNNLGQQFPTNLAIKYVLLLDLHTTPGFSRILLCAEFWVIRALQN
jgi:hypothetical protein